MPPAFFSAKVKGNRKVQTMNSDFQGVDGMEKCENVPYLDWPADEKCCFFARLHSIDCKDAVMPTTFVRLVKIVKDAIERSEEMNGSLMELRTDKGAWVAALNSDVRIRIVSDSIYLWTKSSEWSTEFDSLLHLVSNMLVAGFVDALPLRGVVSYGKLTFDGGDIMDEGTTGALRIDPVPQGPQMSEACELSSRIDLSCVVLTSKVEDELRREFVAGKIKSTATISGPRDIMKHSPYLVVYPVQVGDEIKNRVVVNWNFDTGRDLARGLIHEAFDDLNPAFGNNAGFIRGETLRFYDHTQSLKSSKT